MEIMPVYLSISGSFWKRQVKIYLPVAGNYQEILNDSEFADFSRILISFSPAFVHVWYLPDFNQ